MRTRTPLLAVLISFLISGSACTKMVQSQNNNSTEQIVNVAVAKVSRGDVSRSLELTAEFRPYQDINVHAKVAGYLKEITVDVGDRVQQGQLIATLEIPELDEDLASALATSKRNETEVERSRSELLRAESAHEMTHLSYTRLASVSQKRPNLVAQQESDEALARDRGAEAQVASSKASLTAAQEQVEIAKMNETKIRTMLAYSRISAPFSGIITKRFADHGAMIQAGTASQTQAMPIVELSQVDRLRLVLAAPESIVPTIRVGSSVDVRVPALNKTFKGVVARTAGKIDPATRTMETEVDVANPQYELVPGMYAYVNLAVERHSAVLLVPTQAVSSQGTNPTVMIVADGGKLKEQKVQIGLESPTQIEVTSGLVEGEMVVVGNRNQLKVGQTVQPKVMQASTAGGQS
jgi:RND family efflux transporter MFP subunit